MPKLPLAKRRCKEIGVRAQKIQLEQKKQAAVVSSASSTPTTVVSPSTSATPSTSSSAALSPLQWRRKLFTRDVDWPVEDDCQAIISVNKFGNLMTQSLKCKHCDGDVRLETNASNAVDVILHIICDCCKEMSSTRNERVKALGQKKKQRQTKNNLILVYESLINSLGNVGLNRICGALGFQLFSKGKYWKTTSFLYENMHEHYKELMKDAIEGIFKYYREEEDKVPDEETDLLDIEVSFDSTWLTRGQKSCIGVGFVIEANTGTVIDFAVMSNYCPSCTVAKRSRSKKGFKEWKVTHREDCQANFEGASGRMEAASAKILWNRSAVFKLRYTEFIGDIDSAAYDAICNINDGQGPYDVHVKKVECIDSVSKHLETRLRKLKKEEFTVVNTKTGEKGQMSTPGGANKLTDKVINKLTSSYATAIRKNINKTVPEMKKAILASYLRHISTDENPYQACYPKGEESRCFSKRAVATGERCPSHVAEIPHDDRSGIKQIYKDLTNEDLLKSCIKGRTQNANKSLHSKLWLKCSKNQFAGFKKVTFFTQVTVLDHNFGYKKASLMARLGLSSKQGMAALQAQEVPEKPPKSKKMKTKGR